jgi:hypothetical protein
MGKTSAHNFLFFWDTLYSKNFRLSIPLVRLVRLTLSNSGRELLYETFLGGSVSCLLLSARGIHCWANPRQASSLPGKPSLVKYGRYSSDRKSQSRNSFVVSSTYFTQVRLLICLELASNELCCRATPWSCWEWQWLVFPPCTSVWTLLLMCCVAGLPSGAAGSDSGWCSLNAHLSGPCF